MSDLWGSDVPISMPEPPSDDQPIVYPFVDSGFGFTTGGVAHHISAAWIEEMVLNQYRPTGDV